MVLKESAINTEIAQTMRGKQKTIDVKHRLLVIAFLVFLATSFLAGANDVEAEVAQAPSQLTEADNALKQAFAVILEAEQAGANVTCLLGRLSDGANLLAQAEIACRVGDVSGAMEKAAGVFAIASEVKTDAVRASGLASINSQIAFLSIAAISNVAGFSFILLMFLIWGWFKQNYIKKLRNSKPEVKTSNEG